MYLKDLQVVNFRNYKHQELTFKPGVFIVQGANGQGKSNLLESIYVLCFGKSYRTHREHDLVFWQSPYYYLKGLVFLEERLYQVEVGYEMAKQRKVHKTNGRAGRHLSSELLFPVVFFVPEDLELVRRGPEERRKYMDMEIGQGDPLYAGYLQRYKKALFQKNRLLKTRRPGVSPDALLRPWNEQIVYFGSRLIQRRGEFVRNWNRLAGEHYQRLFEHEPDLEIVYESLGCTCQSLGKVETVEKIFWEELSRVEGKERERGFSLAGPHKDDMIFLLNHRDARRFASHGQQRGIVIALKAAQVQYYKEMGKKPLFLLDDIFSELDEIRREKCYTLFEEAGQVFLTITRKEKYMDNFLTRFNNCYFLSVEKGQVKEI